MGKRKVEILAPAGSYESMVAAVNAGADAVYIGGSRFGARAYADNLDEEAMVRAIRFVHLHGCKIYMTVNTLVKEQELPEIFGFLKPYYEAGLDAVLVQDLGAFSYIREHFPDLPLHISTQMTVTGKYSAMDLKNMGAVRVVPARELSLEEIREIHETTGMEVETFVHGALCYCYSGQCLFSSLIGGRSGNRGRCAQTCRLPFDVSRDESYLNKKNEKYVLSLKDLCTLDLLPDILDAGVCSLKIEGRMKSPRYTAGVVSIYRKYVDMYLANGRKGYHVDPTDRKALLELFDRGGQSEGYYKAHNGRDMVVLKEKPAFREADQELFDFLDKTFVDTVKKIPVKGTAYFQVGKPARLTVEYELGEAAGTLPGGGSMAEKSRKSLKKSGTEPGKKKEESHGKAACAASLLLVNDGDMVEEAKNAPMDEGRIRKQLMKTGDSPFAFESLNITVIGNVFVPVQKLNELRRSALEGMEKEIARLYERTLPVGESPEKGETKRGTEETGMDSRPKTSPEFTVLVSTPAQFEAALAFMKAGSTKCSGGLRFGIYLASEEFDAGDWITLAGRCHDAGVSCYLMLPRVFRTEARQYFLKHMDILKAAGFDAFGVASMEEPGFLREQLPGARLYFDHGMYVWNHLAEKTMKAYGADRITIPVELNAREIAEAGIAGAAELIVYGFLPMMVSAQCVRRTTGGCTKKPELLYLKDRKGKSFPVRNQCRFCYNTIYNESPLSLKGLSGDVKRLSPSALRLNFTIEDERTTAELLRSFYKEFVEESDMTPPAGNFTRGHFKRGVE